MKYMIAYGDEVFRQSRERIRKEAEATGEFDKIIIYSPKDLPEDFRKHPLFKYKRGGGLWVWKAYLTLQTLRQLNEGDILFYADSGSTLSPSKEWSHYFKLLEKKDMVAFKIITRCSAYTKKLVIDYFMPYLGPYWGHYYQVAATTFFIKKTSFTVNLAEEWLSLFTEDMCCDATPEELLDQYDGFKEHRWDQSLLCGVVYRHASRIAIIMNNFENRHDGQAIWASRLRDNVAHKDVVKRSWIKQNIKRPIGILTRGIEQWYWVIRNRIYLHTHQKA